MEAEASSGKAKILFVCTGNTCRSALAEALARRMIEQSGLPWHVASAGVSTVDGAPASENSIQVGREVGLELAEHRARLLTPAMLLEAELILALANSHLEFIRILAPGSTQKLHLLKEYATRSRESGDVADPIGGGPETYRQTLRQLEGLVAASLERFAEDAKSQHH